MYTSTCDVVADTAQDLTEISVSSKTAWKNHVQLGDSRLAVKDVVFAPRHLGLKLVSYSSLECRLPSFIRLQATGSADGHVRVYQAMNVMSLSQWSLQVQNQVFSAPLAYYFHL